MEAPRPAVTLPRLHEANLGGIRVNTRQRGGRCVEGYRLNVGSQEAWRNIISVVEGGTKVLCPRTTFRLPVVPTNVFLRGSLPRRSPQSEGKGSSDMRAILNHLGGDDVVLIVSEHGGVDIERDMKPSLARRILAEAVTVDDGDILLQTGILGRLNF